MQCSCGWCEVSTTCVGLSCVCPLIAAAGHAATSCLRVPCLSLRAFPSLRWSTEGAQQQATHSAADLTAYGDGRCVQARARRLGGHGLLAALRVHPVHELRGGGRPGRRGAQVRHQTGAPECRARGAREWAECRATGVRKWAECRAAAGCS